MQRAGKLRVDIGAPGEARIGAVEIGQDYLRADVRFFLGRGAVHARLREFAVDGQRIEAHAAGQCFDRAGKRELAPQQSVDGGESRAWRVDGAAQHGPDASLAWRARERGGQRQRAAQIALGELREARQIGSRDFRFAVDGRRSGLADESDGGARRLKLGEANIGVAGAIGSRPQIERPMRVRRRGPRRLCRYARRRPSTVRPRLR